MPYASNIFVIVAERQFSWKPDTIQSDSWYRYKIAPDPLGPMVDKDIKLKFKSSRYILKSMTVSNDYLNDTHTSHIFIWYQIFPICCVFTSQQFVFSIIVAFLVVSSDEEIVMISQDDVITTSFWRAIPCHGTDRHTNGISFVHPAENFIGWCHQKLK